MIRLKKPVLINENIICDIDDRNRLLKELISEQKKL